jgi:hypothetical protein
MCRVMRALNFGLLSAIQRRGVTPLVTLKNFSGDTRWKSRSTVRLSEQCQRPALESFGEKRVIRVATGLLGYGPRFLPSIACSSTRRRINSATAAT